MTNIFNKKVLVENGTLIGNWYEEEALKKTTGQTRTIPGFHIPKRKVDGELEITARNPQGRDNTKIRTMGTETISPYATTNLAYGDFSSSEHQFNKIGIKEKIFKDFFTSYLTNEKNEKQIHESTIKNTRLDDTTYRSTHKEQPHIQKIGSRHMLTQDLLPIDQSNLDKLFMANHEMSKLNRAIPDNKAFEYFEELVPYYKDKEITFWAMNSDKSNVYKSHSKGFNSFGKSSGFTQTVNESKSSRQYYGNVEEDKSSRSIFLTPLESKFTEEFINNNKKRIEDLTEAIRQKFFNVFYKKGWMGIRIYKQYLLNLSKRKTTLIEKTDFKYYTTNFGVYLSDQELTFIYNIFDLNKSSKICYEKMINEFLKVRKLLTIYF